MTLLSDFEAVYAAQLFGCTVVRVRGELFVAAGEEPATDVTDFMACAWGIQVIPSNLPATASSPLDPDVQGAYNDWMGYGATHLLTTGDASIQTSGAMDGAGWARIPIDVRARRRMDEMGLTLSLVFDSAPELTVWCFHLSILLMLP